MSSRLTTWLHDLIQDPSRDTTLPPLPPLDAINLAAHALAILGTSPPAEMVAGQVDAHHAQWGYASRPSNAPSWGATITAVETLDLVGVPVSPEITAGIAAELRRQLPAATVTDAPPEEWAARFLSIWALAPRLLAADELNAYRQDVADRLQELAAFLSASECCGFDLVAWVGLLDTAEDLDLPLAPPDFTGCFERLSTPDGFLSLGLDSQPDVLTTYRAALLGRPTSSRLVESVQRRAGAMGWAQPTFAVEPSSTFHAVAISHALGSTRHDEEVRSFVRQWLALIEQHAGNAEQARAGLRDTSFVIRFARELGVEIKPALVAKVGSLVNDPAALTWEVRDRLRLIIVATLLRIEVPIALVEDIERDLASLPPSSPDLLPALVVLQDAAPTEDRWARIAGVANELAVGPAVFASRADMDVPQLRATVTALYGTARLADEGPIAYRTFTNEAGTWGYPPGSAGTQDVTVETTYLGLDLDGRPPHQASSPNHPPLAPPTPSDCRGGADHAAPVALETAADWGYNGADADRGGFADRPDRGRHRARGQQVVIPLLSQHRHRRSVVAR